MSPWEKDYCYLLLTEHLTCLLPDCTANITSPVWTGGKNLPVNLSSCLFTWDQSLQQTGGDGGLSWSVAAVPESPGNEASSFDRVTNSSSLAHRGWMGSPQVEGAGNHPLSFSSPVQRTDKTLARCKRRTRNLQGAGSRQFSIMQCAAKEGVEAGYVCIT